MADLLLTAAHWRAASMFVSKDGDSPLSTICVEPAGEAMVRLIASDGTSALLLRVHAVHALDGPVLVKPLGKNPLQSEISQRMPVELDWRAAEEHPLYATPELLARAFEEADVVGGPVKLHPQLLERLIKAAKLLGSNVSLHVQQINKPALASLTSGYIGGDKAALALLMPLGVRDADAEAVSIQTAWDLFCEEVA